jgi:hypothetical protein
MNTRNKVLLAAFGAAFLTVSAGSAAEQKLVTVDHGRSVTYAFRPGETAPSIAVYVGGRSVGSTMHRHSESEKRDAVIQMGRGQTLSSARSAR